MIVRYVYTYIMKIKPILITLASILMLASITLFVSCNHQKTNKEEITTFLNNFNTWVNDGNSEKLNTLFEVKLAPKSLKKLISLLTGKTDYSGNNKPLTSILLDVASCDIKPIKDDLVFVEIPTALSHEDLEKKKSSITLKIKKTTATQFKIVQIDARKLIADYKDYTNLVKSKTPNNQGEFNPALYESETLAAFKTAAKLKPKYDSVLWFTFNHSKTYYYVVKGKWDLNKDLDIYINPNGEAKDDYNMGLVGPDLKEIIPVKYSLIHNIGGVFPNLIEVESGNNKGLYDLNGKEVVPAKYSHIYPIDDDQNLAVLQDGDIFYYLKKDLSISEKENIKLSDFFSKIKKISNTNDLKKEALKNVIEFNSYSEFDAVYLPASYLVDLGLAKKELEFPSLSRDKLDRPDDVGQQDYTIAPINKIENHDNWFSAFFFAIKDYYIDARYEFYDSKQLLIVDKKKNRLFTQPISGYYVITNLEENFGAYEGSCNINSIKAISDSLFEVKAGAILRFGLYDERKQIIGGPYYHYYLITGDQLVELHNNRNFGFTKYIKMDDSYLTGCYTMLVGHTEQNKGHTESIDASNAELLRFMKNEIYADYNYQFKDNRWKSIFSMFEEKNFSNQDEPQKGKVEDQLTEIDKYNINWITQKLKGSKGSSKVLASK